MYTSDTVRRCRWSWCVPYCMVLQPAFGLDDLPALPVLAGKQSTNSNFAPCLDQCPDWGALVGIHCCVQLWISGSVGGGSCRESGNSVLKEPFLPSQQTALQNVMWLCDDCDDYDLWYHTLLGTVIRWTYHGAAMFILIVDNTNVVQNQSERCS